MNPSQHPDEHPVGAARPPDPEPAAIEVDARGLRCPLPVIRLAEAARNAADRTVVVVLASDPATRYDIPAWCRMRGCELVELREMPEVSAIPAYLRFEVLVRPQRSKGAGRGNESERASRAR